MIVQKNGVGGGKHYFVKVMIVNISFIIVCMLRHLHIRTHTLRCLQRSQLKQCYPNNFLE